MTANVTDLDALRHRFADRYSIDRQLGRGGMGAVYLARDLQLDRFVAIKVLPSVFAAQSELRERFLRETRTAAGFSHPNIVPVFAVEDRGDVLAMAMGYVEGENLAERVTRAGPLSVKETVRLLQDVGYALAYAHGRGVVHRDIKPDNIMLERATGRALVMDFGISRTISNAPAVDTGLTRVGEIVGTPEFMSPEQASGDRVDGRSDLYSLGLVAWYAVTGQLAISGETTQKVLVKQLTETLPPVASARGDLPAPLADAIDRLLNKDPNDRFATAESLVEVIDAAQLSAPEIPLAVRLFQQSSKSYLTNALLVILFAAVNVVRSEDTATLDRLATVSVALALEIVLLATVARQARTLRSLGFDHAALRKGLVAILDEGDEARAQSLAVPGVARKRRFRHYAVFPIFLLGAYNAWSGFARRIEYRPNYFSLSRSGAIIAISGICTMCVAALILVLDPYRRPLMQSLANAFWGGRVGALLMGSTRAVAGSTGTTRPAAAVKASAIKQPDARRTTASPTAAPSSESPRGALSASVVAERFEEIEARLAALEQSRRQSIM